MKHICCLANIHGQIQGSYHYYIGSTEHLLHVHTTFKDDNSFTFNGGNKFSTDIKASAIVVVVFNKQKERKENESIRNILNIQDPTMREFFCI